VTSDEWKKIAHDFEIKWNFPHCIGSIDGKHVVIQSSIHGGSEYYDYKGTFSIILMLLCDADYCVIYSNVDCQEGISDGGMFQHTSLFEKLENGTLHLPEPEPLPMRQKYVPYVFVNNDTLPLKENIMVPFHRFYDSTPLEKIFNYRLFRAQRIVENVFGVMSTVFCVLQKPMTLKPEKATLVTECCVLLHNFLRKSKTSRDIYTPCGTFDIEDNGKIIDGSWRKDTKNITSILPIEKQDRRPCNNAKLIRQEFAEYFVTNGKVEWQNKMI